GRPQNLVSSSLCMVTRFTHLFSSSRCTSLTLYQSSTESTCASSCSMGGTFLSNTIFSTPPDRGSRCIFCGEDMGLPGLVCQCCPSPLSGGSLTFFPLPSVNVS